MDLPALDLRAILVCVAIGLVLAVLLLLARPVQSAARRQVTIDVRNIRDGQRKLQRKSELLSDMYRAWTPSELDELRHRVESHMHRGELFDEDATKILRLIADRTEELEEAEAARVARSADLEPERAKIRALRSIDDPALLADALHRIFTTDEGVVSYQDIQNDWSEETRWLVSTYCSLLVERLRELTTLARTKSPDAPKAYKQALALREEHQERFGLEFNSLVRDELLLEWNEMIALYGLGSGKDFVWDGFA